MKLRGTTAHPSQLLLFAAMLLPMVDIAMIVLIRYVTTPDDRTEVLGLLAIFYPIACSFILLASLLVTRATVFKMGAHVLSTAMTTLVNCILYALVIRWDRTFEAM